MDRETALADNVPCLYIERIEMRKKSHISLARYLVRSLNDEELNKHKFSFYLGSVLPDIKPSFFYKRHEIEKTFPLVQKRIGKMYERGERGKKRDFRFFVNLGQISHYLADYFTFPHNKIYDGGFRGHCSYEEKLKKDLRSYLREKESKENGVKGQQFKSVRALCNYIAGAHQAYIGRKHDVEDDIRHIVEVNRRALGGMMRLFGNQTGPKKKRN